MKKGQPPTIQPPSTSHIGYRGSPPEAVVEDPGPRFGTIFSQGTIGCTPNSIPMIFIVFSRDSWGL